MSSSSGAEAPEDGAVKTPRMPPEMLKALTDCVAAFQDCTEQLRLTQQLFAEHQVRVETAVGEVRTIALRVEAKVDAADKGIEGLRGLLDQDYTSLRDMILTLTTRVDGTKQLAASAYDIGESLTRKLRQAGIINGDETRRPTRAGER